MAFRLTSEQLFDNNGDPLNGGKVHVYEAGTTTNKDSYPTADDANAGTNANTNPVVLDSAGRGEIWGQAGETYKIVIKTSADVTLETIDDISGPNSQQSALGYYVASGSANAQTVTASPSWGSYVTGSVISFKPVADNTGAVTLNVNGLGAKSIKLIDGTDPYASALDATGIALVQYDGTNFILLNPASVTGSYTGTLTGCTTSPTGTIYYTRVGNMVSLLTETGITGTSNTTACTVTGAPAEIRPGVNTGSSLIRTRDNSSDGAGTIRMLTDGSLALSSGSAFSESSFTASGTKGLPAFAFTYYLR